MDSCKTVGLISYMFDSHSSYKLKDSVFHKQFLGLAFCCQQPGKKLPSLELILSFVNGSPQQRAAVRAGWHSLGKISRIEHCKKLSSFPKHPTSANLIWWYPSESSKNRTAPSVEYPICVHIVSTSTKFHELSAQTVHQILSYLTFIIPPYLHQPNFIGLSNSRKSAERSQRKLIVNVKYILMSDQGKMI